MKHFFLHYENLDLTFYQAMFSNNSRFTTMVAKPHALNKGHKRFGLLDSHSISNGNEGRLLLSTSFDLYISMIPAMKAGGRTESLARIPHILLTTSKTPSQLCLPEPPPNHLTPSSTSSKQWEIESWTSLGFPLDVSVPCVAARFSVLTPLGFPRLSPWLAAFGGGDLGKIQWSGNHGEKKEIRTETKEEKLASFSRRMRKRWNKLASFSKKKTRRYNEVATMERRKRLEAETKEEKLASFPRRRKRWNKLASFSKRKPAGQAIRLTRKGTLQLFSKPYAKNK
ncbi:hypothetical protein M5K25_017937 [Dendrobium thyrsiflorum]|uniref:Uncharacterized protein n=1 Tax=Dendrobium thyrsiflorum TaxID=117978 RepID=A0ABD0UNT7_DENTH